MDLKWAMMNVKRNHVEWNAMMIMNEIRRVMNEMNEMKDEEMRWDGKKQKKGTKDNLMDSHEIGLNVLDQTELNWTTIECNVM
jgi:hypothetical protein